MLTFISKTSDQYFIEIRKNRKGLQLFNKRESVPTRYVISSENFCAVELGHCQIGSENVKMHGRSVYFLDITLKGKTVTLQEPASERSSTPSLKRWKETIKQCLQHSKFNPVQWH